MKFTLALLGAAAAVDADTERAFIEYLAEHGKSYGTREEFEFRLNIFADKMQFIEEHNSKNEGDHVVGMNHMMDWTDHEYKKLLGYHAHKKQANPNVFNHTAVQAPPASVDWREKGAVTPIKNQGQCGSCWSFSATGAMEGAFFLKTGKLPSLSEQQLVDCSTSYGNQGCNGGLMDDAFKYAEAKQMDAEADYGYTAKDGSCHASSYTPVEKKLTNLQDITANDPHALMAACAQQPVSIAVDGAALGFQLYHGGILKRFCGTNLDHGVLLVGYGTEDGTDYWIVKNSWGAGWGEKGYLRILREMDKKGPGVCGLQQQPSIPKP